MKANLSTPAPLSRKGNLRITGSKSESNRLLILQALYPSIQIENGSESDDSKVLAKALKNQHGEIDIHHAGTAMRFLTAYFAVQDGQEVVLTGSERMQERPIGVLVTALKDLGANIHYLKEEGYPPLKIQGRTLHKKKVRITAHVSSQFISALMLIGPSLEQGLIIELEGKVTSRPYIQMTLDLMRRCGFQGSFKEQTISIAAVKSVPKATLVVESDWSSASYFYSLVALSTDLEITLSSFSESSLQGDSALAILYKDFGVITEYDSQNHSIHLKKIEMSRSEGIRFDLSNTPDIAQTIAVTCFGLGMECHLSGLHTLKIKETDRLVALKTELEKLGAQVEVTEDSLHLFSSQSIAENCTIDTYHDHRMAMAFAPLAVKVPITINDCEVVSKSYPTFWNDLKELGIEVKH